MTIAVGDKLPAGTFIEMGDAGPAERTVDEVFAGRKVAVIMVPGAFSTTCNNQHLPGFVASAPEFKKKGVDEVVCLAVNDPFVMKSWGETTGASAAGIRMLADPAGEFAKAIGLAFSAPVVGFYDRYTRSSMLVEDGVVKVLNVETAKGAPTCSTGEVLVDQI